MSIPGALIAGFIATSLFFVTTRLTTMNQMGMERYLGTLLTRKEHATLGFVFLFIGGIILSIVYAALWSLKVGWPSYLSGLVFGIVQWLVVGFVIAALPLVHVGIRAGTVPAPGIYMTNLLGRWAFVAGLVNHVIFGLTVTFFYQFFKNPYG